MKLHNKTRFFRIGIVPWAFRYHLETEVLIEVARPGVGFADFEEELRGAMGENVTQ
jgi:hypothetical protein